MPPCIPPRVPNKWPRPAASWLRWPPSCPRGWASSSFERDGRPGACLRLAGTNHIGYTGTVTPPEPGPVRHTGTARHGAVAGKLELLAVEQPVTRLATIADAPALHRIGKPAGGFIVGDPARQPGMRQRRLFDLQRPFGMGCL